MKIAVIGAGSWGTALALYLADIGHRVRLWVYREEGAEEIIEKRENVIYLPGFPFPENLTPSFDFEFCLDEAEIVLTVVPTQVYRNVIPQFLPYVKKDMVFLSASKGIENNTLKRVTEILHEFLDPKGVEHIGVISGPSFAKEVAKKYPTAVTVAFPDEDTAKEVQHAFASEYFRLYRNTDVAGIEVCGALKNVIALASGMVEGLGYGANTRAALITRGLVEITRIGLVLGGEPETFPGLAGMGDLVLTCTSTLSRNFSVGRELGKGKTIEEIMSHMRMVAEGVKTAISVKQLVEKTGVEMPISEKVYEIIYDKKDPKLGVTELMTRSLKSEKEIF